MRSSLQSLALAAATLFLLAAGPTTEGSSGKWKARNVRQAEGGCLLPVQPDNGQYFLGGCEAPQCRVRPGDSVEFFAVLNYTCAPGFALSGASVVFCEGQWSPSPPSCVPEPTGRFCSPLSSSAHEIECSLNNNPVSCDKGVVPQTRAIVRCKLFYEAPPDKIDYVITCEKNGFWSESLFPCTPECGEFDFNITRETEDGVDKNIPWYAALMMKDAKGVWKFACSASLISPRVLVSVAHCVWKELDKKVADARNYGVVTGKFEHGPKEVTSTVSQMRLVEKIYVPDTFRGYERRYEEDISVIILKDEIIINKFIHPICIDFDDKYAPYFVPGEKGIIGSWGEPENHTYKQRVVSLPVVDFEECLKSIPPDFHSYLTYDKFCAGILKKKTVCSGDSGVGYASKFKDGKWYLTGISSVGVTPSDGKSCEIDFYKGFTRVSLFLKFIKQYHGEITNSVTSKPPIVSCRENEFKCDSNECVRASYLCDGIKHCSDGSDETYEECHLKKCPSTSFQCRYGACVRKSYQCNGWKECQDESDEDPILCKENVTVISTSCSDSPPSSCLLPQQPENGYYTFIGCKSNGQHLPGLTVAAGVLLNYSCNPGYVLSGPSLLACFDGWSSLPPSCNPVLCPPLQNPTREVQKCIWNRENVDCTFKSVKPGTRAIVRCRSNYESIPGLREYDLICEANGKWNREFHSCVPKCGIPNARGVQFISFGRPSLTAEFPWHVGLYELYEGKIVPTCGGTIVSPHVIISAAHCFWRSDKLSFEQYKVVAGKYYYEWERKIQYVQHLEIKNVIIHENFRGREKNYENDIALIILKSRIVINEAVRPICMDYEKNYLNYFSPGGIGNVSGWGMNENGSYSATLTVANLSYVNITECENNTPHQFHSLLTNDKFCAGNLNKTSVCGGDSGGGYAIRFKDGRSYLVGIVSAGPTDIPCGKLTYVTFTNVYHHLELIKHYVYKYV